MRTTMPSESLTAAVGSIVSAVLILVGTYSEVEVPAEAAGAIILLVSWMAFGLTLLVRWRRATARPRPDVSAEAAPPHNGG